MINKKKESAITHTKGLVKNNALAGNTVKACQSAMKNEKNITNNKNNHSKVFLNTCDSSSKKPFLKKI